MIENGFVKGVLVFEVVIQEGLIDMCRTRNRIGPGAGNAVLCKLSDGCSQDRTAAFLGTPRVPYRGIEERDLRGALLTVAFARLARLGVSLVNTGIVRLN